MVQARRAAIVSAAVAAIAIAAARGPRAADQDGSRGGRWYKGNTHTHTLNSDGDSTPDDVVRWYREHGYQFLVPVSYTHLTLPTILRV